MSDIGNLEASLSLAGTPGTSWRHALLRRMVARLRYGRLTCVTPDGRVIERRAPLPGPEARLVLHRWRALRSLILGGDDGFAESFLRGDWSSPDLTAFLTLAAQNFDGRFRTPWPLRALHRLRHGLNANSRRGAKRNIMAHYDLGNDFYAAWLDRSMLYSSALYEHPHEALDQAQERKLALVTDWLGAEPGDRVLEIGCGWGALARRLGHLGAHVTALTLSPAQRSFAQDAVAEAELQVEVSVHLRDYRDEGGQYDRIVSIEMMEAVGEAYWPVYFRALRDCLRPGGRAVLQVITIEAARFGTYRTTPDFIQQHIFPGGMLPAKAHIDREARRANLRPVRSRHFGESYALTLAAWRARFLAAWPDLQALGFDERFRRLWLYYLGYCEAGFRTGAIDVGLYELQG